MQLIEWMDEFRTGIASVDHEHRALIDLLNELAEQVGANAEHETVQEFLGEVYARIEAHFALEERLMRQIGYHEYVEHKAEHDRLLNEIRDIMDRHLEGGFAHYREELSARLRDWFVTHFKTMDPRLHLVLK